MNYTFPDLSRLVKPASVVIVGASDRRDSIGGRAFYNLVEESDFPGTLWLVNPGRAEVAGRPCARSVTVLPEAPDLAVIAIPAPGVLTALKDCAARGVAFAIVLSSGFGEMGDAGKAIEAEMRALAAATGMRIYGPNCPGLSNVNDRLGFTFSPAFKLDLVKGPLGVATQGGGLGRTILQAMERGIGVGLWCSAGNEVDLEVSDFIHYMAGAPDIQVIVTLIEGIRDGAKFVGAVRRAADMGKPVVALKVGKSDYGVKATLSHTAAIAGSAEINSAAFRQLGVVEVDDVDELIDTAWLLARATPRAAERIAVYCSSGGTAALAADMVGSAGLALADFAPTTTARLSELLPSFAAIGNPVDTTAEVLADMTVIDRSLQAVADDPHVGLILHPFPMEYGAATTQAAESVVRVQAASRTPIVPIWISDRRGGGLTALNEAGMAPVRSVGKAVKAVSRWAEYGNWLASHDSGWRPMILDHIERGDARRETLGEADAKTFLAASGIALLAAELAFSRDGACRIAERIGFPVVAKVASAEIVHKSDIGGVRVGLADTTAVGAAWDAIHAAVGAAAPATQIDGVLIEAMAPPGGVETLIGVHRDPVFGPVLTFGLGGIYVEVFKDVSRRLLPLTPTDAHAMISEVCCFALLDGARGRPKADIAALEALLLKVSDFVIAHEVEEMDLNPVWVGAVGQGAIPLDAVIIRRSGPR